MKNAQNRMNGDGTCTPTNAESVQSGSRPVRSFELIDRDGNIHGPFSSSIQARAYADTSWPDQEQDEDRTGKGWDVQVVGGPSR